MTAAGWLFFFACFAAAILSGLFISVWVGFAILTFVGFIIAVITYDMWCDW